MFCSFGFDKEATQMNESTQRRANQIREVKFFKENIILRGNFLINNQPPPLPLVKTLRQTSLQNADFQYDKYKFFFFIISI